MKKIRIVPPGYWRCSDCGEFNGVTEAKHLDWPPGFTNYDPERLESVTCRCHGPLCSQCKMNHVNGSGTNAYDEDTNTVGHWPWFAGMMPCFECRASEKSKAGS